MGLPRGCGARGLAALVHRVLPEAAPADVHPVALALAGLADVVVGVADGPAVWGRRVPVLGAPFPRALVVAFLTAFVGAFTCPAVPPALLAAFAGALLVRRLCPFPRGERDLARVALETAETASGVMKYRSFSTGFVQAWRNAWAKSVPSKIRTRS